MKISIILGHPKKESFNHAIADTAELFFQNRGDHVYFHDLYQERFDPLERLWKNCIFGLCGMQNVYRKMYDIICISTLEQRKKWLEDVQTTLETVFQR